MNSSDNVTPILSADAGRVLDMPTTATHEPAKRELSVSTAAWNDAAIEAGNKADRDPAFAGQVGAGLF